MKPRTMLLSVSLVVALAACDLGNILCTGGSVCTSTSLSGPSAAPSPTASLQTTPTPSPSPSASPGEDCRIDYMLLRPAEGLTLAKDESARLSLTPYQTVTNPDGSKAQREVSAACNDPRIPSIVWSSSSVAVRVGFGFEPVATRVGVGIATVTASIEGHVSNAVEIR